MIVKSASSLYETTVGIECHVQLKTKTKLFSGVLNDARNAKPNTLISHICLGMPGALPVLNSRAIILAIKAGFALNTDPQHFSKFDRKHYFYPDLPKGYQITQYEQPIILGGYVDIVVDGQKSRVGITRAHLEEDAGKSIHPSSKDYSLVDLNRAGTPLLEIVSEPEMHSPAQVKAFAKELYLLMRYADVSDADLFYGNMRFDVNVSVSKDKKLGTRTEVKNLNSFKSVEKAVEFETERQIKVLESGKRVIQETMGWDNAKQKTFSQRSKEEAHDYRYFPEPDIPPIELDKKVVQEIKNNMPIMPSKLRDKLESLDIDESSINTLVDEMLPGEFMLKVVKSSDKQTAKRIANWLIGELQAMVVSEKLSWGEAKLEVNSFEQLSKLVEDNLISSTNAKVVLSHLVIHGGDPLQIAKEKNLIQQSDKDEISKIVKKVIEENPQAATDVKKGEMKAIGFLVGQVMKLSEGKANPKIAQELIKKQIS